MTLNLPSVFCATVLFGTLGTVPVAQSADDAWRDMYSHLECIALSEKAPHSLTAQADAHLEAALEILTNTPDVFSARAPDFVPNGSNADSFGRPADAGVDARVHMGRILQVIALQTRMRVQGPDPVYAEGMTVSPSSQNLVMQQNDYAAEYRKRNCLDLLDG